MKDNIMRLCGTLALCLHIGIRAYATDSNSESKGTPAVYYFSSGGVVNNNNQIFKESTRWIINKCQTGYEMGARCPIDEAFADKIFTLKPGMYLKTFSNSKPTCSGEIEGFDFISFETMNGFYIRSKCNAPNFAVIANSKEELKVVLGETSSEVTASSITTTLRDSVIAYYSTRADDLREIISGYGRNTEQLTEAELLDILKLETNLKVTAIHPKNPKESQEIYLINWGSKFLYTALPSGKIQYLGFSQIRQLISINGIPYVLTKQQQPGTGGSTDNLYRIYEDELANVFSENAFSN